MVRILIVEDDYNVRRLFKETLLDEGFDVFAANNGNEALDIIDKQSIDLILLDIVMPEMDGLSLTRLLRQTNINLPIIIISAKSEPKSKREGFVSGIDDYMVKPVDLKELVLRINAILRRAKISNEHKLNIGECTLNSDTFSVTKGNLNIELPKKEFLLLFKLLSYPNKIFTRLQLMDEIWGMDSESQENTVNVHINKLRSKFAAFNEFDIITIRGLGYKGVINHEL